MAPEDYELFLWVLGDRAILLNVLSLAIVGIWSVGSMLYIAYTRLIAYIDYRIDYAFWGDLLAEDHNA